jgi:hypothetical protein
MIYSICEVDHQQTYTPLFDRERFPSPFFRIYIKKALFVNLVTFEAILG